MSQLPPPTDEVARLVELIGPEAALRLVEARGGTRVYLSDRQSSTLVDIIGLDGIAGLRSRYGAGWYKVPIARQWRVLCYLAEGLTQEKAALKAGCGINSVARAIRDFGHPDGRFEQQPSRQMDLFKG